MSGELEVVDPDFHGNPEPSRAVAAPLEEGMDSWLLWFPSGLPLVGYVSDLCKNLKLHSLMHVLLPLLHSTNETHTIE